MLSSGIKIDQLIRSNRRTIGLQITTDACLIVRAPYRASEEYIQKLILQKESWIKEKQEHLRQKKNQFKPKQFIPGEEFLFLGESYPLIASENLVKAVILDNNLMISSLVLANAQEHLENWYKQKALEHLNQRVSHYAKMTSLTYQSVKISNAATRWGSCSYKDSLNFSWKLIMAPARVIDYVVVHELMHIKQRNHSRKFWTEVANIIPDYKTDESWLKNNGHLLKWLSA